MTIDVRLGGLGLALLMLYVLIVYGPYFFIVLGVLIYGMSGRMEEKIK